MSRNPPRKGKQPLPPSSSSTRESVFLLDKFTNADLRVWQKISEDLVKYEYRLYYSLEGQRASGYEDLCNALRSSKSCTFKFKDWYRIVDYRYSLQPLSTRGSVNWTGGRFNTGKRTDPSRFVTFNALYLAEDIETAWREKFGLSQSKSRGGLSSEELALCETNSITSVKVKGIINDIFDLTNLSNLESFAKIIANFSIPQEVISLAKDLDIRKPRTLKTPKEIRDSLLEQDWRARPARFDIPANSQIFGKLLLDSGFEGVLYPSTKGKKKCVAIFPTTLENSESFVELVDRAPEGVSFRKLNASTWHKAV